MRGVICWVGTETRALNSPIMAEIKRATPFAEYSSKGFLMSVVAMLTLATINAILCMNSLDILQ